MASATRRTVDTLPTITNRPVPMQVLCLGLSRTSTMTMQTALEKLGYRSYHFVEAGKNTAAGKKHLMCWVEALNAKIYGVGKRFGRKEFDKILGEYSAVADTPCANLYAELIAAYPDAKVILTTRDPDKWLQSMEISLLAILEWRIWSIMKPFGYFGLYKIKAAHDALELAIIDWTSGYPKDRDALCRGFLAHNENVRSLVPRENLLEFNPKQGWEPLCKFLEKDAPNEPFPHANKGGNITNMVLNTLILRILKEASKLLPVLLVAWILYTWMDDERRERRF